MKIKNLLSRDYKIVEQKWKWFIAPAVVLLVAIIACVIFALTAGSAFNLGMDFTGGYKVNVRLGNKLTDATFASYKATAIEIAENLKDEEGNAYGIKVSSITRENEADTASIMLKYQAVASEEKMTEIKPVTTVEKIEETKDPIVLIPVVSIGASLFRNSFQSMERIWSSKSVSYRIFFFGRYFIRLRSRFMVSFYWLFWHRCGSANPGIPYAT